MTSRAWAALVVSAALGVTLCGCATTVPHAQVHGVQVVLRRSVRACQHPARVPPAVIDTCLRMVCQKHRHIMDTYGKSVSTREAVPFYAPSCTSTALLSGVLAEALERAASWQVVSVLGRGVSRLSVRVTANGSIRFTYIWAHPRQGFWMQFDPVTAKLHDEAGIGLSTVK